MQIEKFSDEFKVHRLKEEQLDEILELCESNPLYYEYHPPFITREEALKDMTALPPDTQMSQKYYVGFYEKDKLIAMLDVIDGWPEASIAFIGFFMIHRCVQGSGVGTRIVSSICKQLKQEGFETARLAWIKGNPQSEHFWLKNQFQVVKETTSLDGNSVILGERNLT